MNIKQELSKRGLPTESYPIVQWPLPYDSSNEFKTNYPIEKSWLLEYLHNGKELAVGFAKEFNQEIEEAKNNYSSLVSYVSNLDKQQLAKFLELFAMEYYERGQDSERE